MSDQIKNKDNKIFLYTDYERQTFFKKPQNYQNKRFNGIPRDYELCTH